MLLSSVVENLSLRGAFRAVPPGVGRQLQHLAFGPNDQLWSQNVPIPYAFFPLSGAISLRVSDGARRKVEIGQLGREGFGDVSLLLGGTTTQAAAIALTTGEGVTMAPEAFRLHLRRHRFRSAMEDYAVMYLLMVSKLAVCNRVHGIREVCAGRLLLMLDRTPRQTFDITQESLSRQLGVRRASISTAVSRLQEYGAIEYDRRGHLTVSSRGELEKLACPCYHAIKAAFDRRMSLRLLPALPLAEPPDTVDLDIVPDS